MQPPSTFGLPLFLDLLLGALIGCGLFWLLQRSRIDTIRQQDKNEGLVEITQLQEKLAAALNNLNRMQREHQESAQQVEHWRQQFEKTRQENAQLAERASRVIHLEAQLAQLTEAHAEAQDELTRMTTQLAERSQLLRSVQQEKTELIQQRELLTTEQRELAKQRAELQTALNAERQHGEEKLAILNNAREQLSDQFKALASEILEEKSKRFTEQNQTNIGALLDPLKIRLQEFQGKVEEVYVQEGKDRSALAEQVRQLMGLNQQLSLEAHNLTRALKGQAKAQGNWGELILERVLEMSGLANGVHYQTQESHTRDDGSRAQPDVIIRLPEGRHLVVDAKVSLNAYDDHVNAESDLERDNAIKRHLDSVRTHIKGLSSKNYQELYQLKSLDFVIMFVPVEPAFMLAISHDSEVWQEAWTKNVLLVSPSTLLFVVRTVSHLWRQEQQNRNAQDIAKRGAELYDKLVGFVTDLTEVGTRLNQARNSYDQALSKLSSGRGNVIRQAELLKELGIKPTRSLPPNLIDIALETPDNLAHHEAQAHDTQL